MKPGDMVHNQVYDTFGIITSELETCRLAGTDIVERRFMVLYNKPLNHYTPGLHVMTGSRSLTSTERLCHRHHTNQKREGERCC